MKKVIMKDYSEWEWDRSNNGGNYGYEEFAIVSDSGDIISGEHWTTSDFYYCPMCGSFESDPHRHLCNKYIPSALMQAVLEGATVVPEGITVEIEEIAGQ